MGLMDEFLKQKRFYEGEGSLGAGLLDFRPNIADGPAALEARMNEDYKTYLGRKADPVSYYQENPKAQGLIDVTPEMDVIDFVGGLAPKAAMYMGAKALNAPLDMMGMGKKMLSEGVDPADVKRMTGVEVDLLGNPIWEISDSQAKLLPFKGIKGNTVSDIMKHDRLMKHYPDLGGVKVIPSGKISDMYGTGGASYSPYDDAITIDQGLLEKPTSDTISVLLHELQHAIQNRENLPTGANPKNISRQLQKAQDSELTALGLWGSVITGRRSSRTLSKIQEAEYVKGWEDKVKKESMRPSAIRNTTEWYMYHDKITDKFGSMPKKAGSDRDNWLRNAAAYIRNQERDKLSSNSKAYLQMLNDDPKAVAAEKRRLIKQRNESAPQVQKANEIGKKYDELDRMGAYNTYLASTGERQARATQARQGLMDEARRQNLSKGWDTEGFDPKTDLEWALLPKDAYGSMSPFWHEYLPK